MDCHTIEINEIAEKYVIGELSEAENQSFEEHIFSCDHCFSEAVRAEKLICGLEILDREGAMVFQDTSRRRRIPFFNWIDYRPSPVFALILTLLVIVLIYPAWRGLIVLPKLSTKLEEIQTPIPNVQSYSLQLPTRGEVQTILLSQEHGDFFILQFNLHPKKKLDSIYHAKVTDHNERIIWYSENLKSTDEFNAFSILFHSSYFYDGVHTLDVYEIDPVTDKIVNESYFTFRIIRQGYE